MKKITMLLLCISAVIAFSCNQNNTVKTNDTTSSVDSIEVQTRMVDSLLSISDSVMNQNGRVDICAPEHRQILRVESFSAVNANYIENSKTNSIRSLILVGKASPSSCPHLNKAYIHFVADTVKLRQPTFGLRIAPNGSKSAELRIFLHEKYFEGVMLALNSAKEIYCWRGDFGNNYIYGDLETNRTLPLIIN